MKIDIKRLSIFLVVFNTITIFKDLPLLITLSTLAILIISFFIHHKVVRNILKISFLFAGIFLIRTLFRPLLVTEAGVSLVMILSALKVWELDTVDDHFNMFLILALFEACLFLLNPSFITFFFGLLKIIIFFYFILKIRNYDLSLLSGKRLLYLVAPSLLLSLLLFYTFPRFTQGFINASNNQMLFSGNDSQLNFKKLGPLTLSSKVVFKVRGLSQYKFPYPLLYWRENILWDYYKEEWRTSYHNFRAEPLPISKQVASYQVQLSKDYNEFLPTLDGNSHLAKSSLDYSYYSEGSFRLKNISRSVVYYEVNTGYQENESRFLPAMEKKGLRLKSERKEEIKKLILNNQNENQLSDQDKFNLAVDFFKSRHYEYSLNPPVYPSLEEFILNGKSGYCSHFSASFAYIARAIGLPTRIVSGYQGGEYNPFDQSLIIRELDAHAWVEVYLKNSGWFKFDPTAIVAPGRIELGANIFNDQVEPYINLYYYKLPKSFIKFASLNKFSQWLDSLDSLFNSQIFNFDKDRQQQILSSLLPKSLSIGWLFVISLIGSMPLFWILFTLLSRKKQDPNEVRYKKFLRYMEKQGVVKAPNETASHFCQRCLSETSGFNQIILDETEHYLRVFYRESSR